MGLHLGSCFSRRRVISMILLGVLCNVGNAQSGTIKGNVFFKYNDLIGNRADAGSQVILYSQADSTFATTTADLQGNFVYDNLQPGWRNQKHDQTNRHKNSRGSHPPTWMCDCSGSAARCRDCIRT